MVAEPKKAPRKGTVSDVAGAGPHLLEDKMVNIIFEFVGGPQDGKVLLGRLGEPSDAERYYLFSNRGAVGHRFKVASNYAVATLAEEQLKEDRRHHFHHHYYVVTDRIEDGDEVRVRAEYVPQTTDPNRDPP